CTFLILPSLAMAAISERKREPVVVKATTDKFPSWVDNGTPAAGLEWWAFKNGSWTPVPYQVDEVSRNVQDVKPFIDPAQFSGAQCQGGASGTPPAWDGPCEFLYDLRGTAAPSGDFTTNDEIVFLAGNAGDCGVSTSSWPSSDLQDIRYLIQVADNPSGSELG